MAHWWELWSPGLQAAGGMVELLGATFLAWEWFIAGREARFDKEMRAFEIQQIRSDIADLKAEFQRSILFDSYFLKKSRRNIYVLGFIIIICGVVLQVSGNSIAWGSAYGLIS
jgi:hypothetical protein